LYIPGIAGKYAFPAAKMGLQAHYCGGISGIERCPGAENEQRLLWVEIAPEDPDLEQFCAFRTNLSDVDIVIPWVARRPDYILVENHCTEREILMS
jgi:hypothetical protein